METETTRIQWTGEPLGASAADASLVDVELLDALRRCVEIPKAPDYSSDEVMSDEDFMQALKSMTTGEAH